LAKGPENDGRFTKSSPEPGKDSRCGLFLSGRLELDADIGDGRAVLNGSLMAREVAEEKVVAYPEPVPPDEFDNGLCAVAHYRRDQLRVHSRNPRSVRPSSHVLCQCEP
jgi:hypothetical protein